MNSRQAIAVVLSAIFFTIPVIAYSILLINVLILFFAFAIFAASWDLIFGYTGQLTLGQTFPYGLSGFVSALLVTNYPVPWKINLGFNISPIAALLIGALAATLASSVLAFPALRVKGNSLVIVSVATPLIVQQLFIKIWGEEGIPQVSHLVQDTVQLYYFGLVLTILVYLSLYWILRTSIGLRFRAIREDELAAQTSGINIVRYKFLAYSISSFYAGLAGSYFTFFTSRADPTMFSLSVMFQGASMVLVGGLGTLVGPLVGAFLLTFASGYLEYVSTYRLLLYAAAVIIIIMFLPKGLMHPFLERFRRKAV